MQSDATWFPGFPAIHFLLYHLSHWQSFIGALVALAGVVYALRKNYRNSVQIEALKRNWESNALRVVFTVEIHSTIGKAARHLNEIIPRDLESQEKLTSIPGRFAMPMYEAYKGSINRLTENEIASLMHVRNTVTALTDGLVHEAAVGNAQRRNFATLPEEDSFKVKVPSALLDTRLKDIVRAGEKAINDFKQNRQADDVPKDLRAVLIKSKKH